MFAYKTSNNNRREPELPANCVRVKGKADGSETIVLTHQPENIEEAVAISTDAAQQILDDWVNEENSVEVIDITTGERIYQDFIDLSRYNG